MKNPIKNNTGQNLTRIKNIKKSKNLKVLEKLKNEIHITHRLTLEPHQIIRKNAIEKSIWVEIVRVSTDISIKMQNGSIRYQPYPSGSGSYQPTGQLPHHSNYPPSR